MNREQLRQLISSAADQGTSMQEAEKYAAQFLDAQLALSEELQTAELDRRMRKRGLKALKSAVRTNAIRTAEGSRKPTEGVLDDIVNMDELVSGEEASFDEAEVKADALERDYNVFKDAHIYFRGVAKGSFGG
jgi:hypothetical protein